MNDEQKVEDDFALPEARKYPRTYHLPFSPGTTSDDRIARDISSIVSGRRVVMTEKLDGENTCLNARGVFSRSHGAPTRNPWATAMWDIHKRIQSDLTSLELFGESLYAVHSIKYSGLPSYFHLFAIRDGDRWLSWDEVAEYAAILDLPTVPVLHDGLIMPNELKPLVEAQIALASALSGSEPLPASPREGIVIRLADEIPDDRFTTSVFKWVRKGHVGTSTTSHWSKTWERAYLGFELEKMSLEKSTAWLLKKAGR